MPPPPALPQPPSTNSDLLKWRSSLHDWIKTQTNHLRPPCKPLSPVSFLLSPVLPSPPPPPPLQTQTSNPLQTKSSFSFSTPPKNYNNTPMNTGSVDSFAQLCKCTRRLKLLLIMEKSLAWGGGFNKVITVEQLAPCDYSHVAIAAIMLALRSGCGFELMDHSLKLQGAMTSNSQCRGTCQTK